MKDRVIDIMPSLAEIVRTYIKGKNPVDSVFELEFHPTTEIQLTDTTLDAALKTLYTASPQLVTLSSGSTSIRGDYNIYWKGGTTNKYYLEHITFITPRTSLIAGTQTKTLN
jgi:hypothetical protein